MMHFTDACCIVLHTPYSIIFMQSATAAATTDPASAGGADTTADKLSRYGDYSSNNASNSSGAGGSRAPMAAARG